ncbi:hypothetical protein B0O80DRAFT_461748 [Mortierella sp. GBAus27b]|nr:hypothetical protein B0O80DRAFT_461748 [Mortierella sp. GBAus27b]
MAPTDSFILFGSITQESRILWMSPTAYDVLGYKPEDVIGRAGYEIVSPDDHADAHDFRKENHKNDFIASQGDVRFIRKDGVVLACVVLVSLCYDFTIGIVTVQDSDAETCKSDQWRRVDSGSFTNISLEEVSHLTSRLCPDVALKQLMYHNVHPQSSHFVRFFRSSTTNTLYYN